MVTRDIGSVPANIIPLGLFLLERPDSGIDDGQTDNRERD